MGVGVGGVVGGWAAGQVGSGWVGAWGWVVGGRGSGGGFCCVFSGCVGGAGWMGDTVLMASRAYPEKCFLVTG